MVVMAILVTVVAFTYTGIQKDARNASRLTEAKRWAEILDIYATKNRQYPPVAFDNAHTMYCLGTGYTDVSNNTGVASPDGVPDCGDVYYGPSKASENATFANYLKTIADIPQPGDRTLLGTGQVGSYVLYDTIGTVASNPTVRVEVWLEGGPSDCKAPFTSHFTNSTTKVVLCRLTLHEHS